MEKRLVNCPLCGKPTEYSPENPFRPFCSERCRLIDLGQWADGKYTIPVTTPVQASEDNETEELSLADSDDEAENESSQYEPH